MTIVVVATIYPDPDHRSEVIAAFEEIVAQVHANDEGCERYALHEGDDRLVMIERWTSEEALAAHGQSETMAKLGDRLTGKVLGEADVQVLRPHPAGTDQQGII